MTFLSNGRGRQDGSVGGERGWVVTETGEWVDVPTEREPSTAIFLFFKMSPVIAESSGGGGGREREGRGRIKGRGEGL